MPLFIATLLPAAGGVKKITNNIKEHTNKNTNRESDYRAHFISVSDVTPGGSVPIKEIVNIPHTLSECLHPLLICQTCLPHSCLLSNSITTVYLSCKARL